MASSMGGIVAIDIVSDHQRRPPASINPARRRGRCCGVRNVDAT
jgi:hypothetical protein